MGTRSEDREVVRDWFAMMHGCYQAMPQNEREALLQWEKENLGDGKTGTSDWPGWEKYIGSPPWKDFPPPTKTAKRPSIAFQLRWEVFKRDGFKCVDCGTQDDLSADHVIPFSRGGPTTLENLKTRCRTCNSRKGTKPEVSAC